MTYYAIAIDGPAGAGKSTIAKILSKKLNYRYLDTGATFRTVALKVVQSGLDTKNKEHVLSVLKDLDIKVCFEDSGQVNYLDGVNVNDKIRSPEIDIGSSNVSVFPEVRLKLIEIWRDVARNNNIIMDGRDIGTLVLPDATLKIFLTASIEERTKRRLKDMEQKGIKMSFDELKKAIEERDYQDCNKELGALVVAEDAVIIDTTNMTIEQVVDKIIELLNSRIN